MENWRDVVGYEGLYQVSDQGRVWRMPGTPKCIAGRFLKPRAAGAGYHAVGLWKDGVQTYCYIHRIVMRAFVGECPDGHNVNHRSGTKTENWLSNLEYTTFSGNIRHAFEAGLLPGPPPQMGEKNVNAKIDRFQAGTIKAALVARESVTALGRRMGISADIIWSIKRGITWRQVPWPPLEDGEPGPAIDPQPTLASPPGS